MMLTVIGSDADYLGYGRFAQTTRTALSNVGVDVFDGIDGDPSPWAKHSKPGRTQGLLACTLPGQVSGWLEGQHRTIFTMYETDRIPDAFASHLCNFDQLLVPNFANAEAFAEWHDNISVVPLALDPRWQPYPTPPFLDGVFTVLVAGAGERKGPLLVYDAFRKAFPEPASMDPMPMLVHKSKPGIRQIDDPSVVTIDKFLSAEDELAVYRSCHVYVSGSRGEGFGYMPLQAMATGRPTILADAHGHSWFAKYGYPVSVEKKPARYDIFGPSGDWWEPNIDEMIDHLRWVYSRYDDAAQAAQEMAPRIVEEFSLRRYAANLSMLLPFGPYEGSGEWAKADELLVPLAVTQPTRAEIADREFFFVPGHRYDVTADVARVIHDAGFGDKRYRAFRTGATVNHPYCPTCHHKIEERVMPG